MFTKPIDEITFEDVKSFCKEWAEGVRVEYKQEIKHIPKIVSSFANTLGGIFIIGVKTDEENKAILPIEGIPKRSGIMEQIQQSAGDGIYPSIMPDVKIVDVPNTNNVVVVLRVDESLQAPHVQQNSPVVYIREGSTTPPYVYADVDRIDYLLKRRENSQIVADQILERIGMRADRNMRQNVPTLTLIARPMFPYRPVISTLDIYELYADRRYGISRVVGGISKHGSDAHLEVNEYGIVFYRPILHCPDEYGINSIT